MCYVVCVVCFVIVISMCVSYDSVPEHPEHVYKCVCDTQKV